MWHWRAVLWEREHKVVRNWLVIQPYSKRGYLSFSGQNWETALKCTHYSTAFYSSLDASPSLFNKKSNSKALSFKWGSRSFEVPWQALFLKRLPSPLAVDRNNFRCTGSYFIVCFWSFSLFLESNSHTRPFEAVKMVRFVSLIWRRRESKPRQPQWGLGICSVSQSASEVGIIH